MMQNPLANSLSQTDTTPGGSGRLVFLKRLVKRHPYGSALLFLVYWFVLRLGLVQFFLPTLDLLHIHPPFLQENLLSEFLVALMVALPISLLGWWSETGFTRGINWRGLDICLVPLVLLVVPVLETVPVSVLRASGSVLVTAAALSLLVGFAEEGFFRGLTLRILLPKGIWPAVLLSSLFFTVIHLANLFAGLPWSYVAGQLLLAFGSGVLFAAVCLRTGSIWPGILLHAARDVIGLIVLGTDPQLMLSTPLRGALTVNGVFCVLFLVNAYVLLRPKQLHKLKVVYGLAPTPM